MDYHSVIDRASHLHFSLLAITPAASAVLIFLAVLLFTISFCITSCDRGLSDSEAKKLILEIYGSPLENFEGFFLCYNQKFDTVNDYHYQHHRKLFSLIILKKPCEYLKSPVSVQNHRSFFLSLKIWNTIALAIPPFLKLENALSR